MHFLLRHLRSDLPAPRRLRTAYILIAACLLLIDFFTAVRHGTGFKGTFSATVTLAIFVSVVLSGWYSRLGGILITIFSLIGLHAPPEYASIGISGNAIHLVCVDWISRRRIGEAVIAMSLVDASILLGSSADDLPYAVALLVIEWIASFVSGLLFYWARNERQSLARKVTDLEDEIRKTRHDLSLRLHDSVAAELTKVILLSDELTHLTSETDIQRQSEAITRHGRSALATIREIITFNASRRTTPASLVSTVESSTRLLDSHRVTLSVEMPEGLDSALSYATCDLLCLTIREGCLNICKYAQKNSTASLSIEHLDDGTIDCVLSNRVESDERRTNLDEALSGGFGLRTLQESAELIGADVTYGRSGSYWFLALSIPGSTEYVRFLPPGEENQPLPDELAMRSMNT